MKQLQRIFKALGNQRRLAIVQLLKKRRELSVNSIARIMELSQTATSRHLNILFNADILEKRQESLVVYYRLADDPSTRLKAILGQISE